MKKKIHFLLTFLQLLSKSRTESKGGKKNIKPKLLLHHPESKRNEYIHWNKCKCAKLQNLAHWSL